MPPLPIVVALVIFSLFVALDFAALPIVNSYHAGLYMHPAAAGPVELMRIVISCVLLIAALWVILSRRYVATDRHWAYATIGTIVGYWLGGA